MFPVLCLKGEKPYKQTIIVIQGIDFPGKVTRWFLENASGMLVWLTVLCPRKSAYFSEPTFFSEIEEQFSSIMRSKQVSLQGVVFRNHRLISRRSISSQSFFFHYLYTFSSCCYCSAAFSFTLNCWKKNLNPNNFRNISDVQRRTISVKCWLIVI